MDDAGPVEIMVKKGHREVRKIFDENISHNKKMGRDEGCALFECIYDSTRANYKREFGRINDGTFKKGLDTLHREFGFIGDNGKPLRITLRMLRDTLENNLPKDVRMHDKARVLNHKDRDTTGTIYETVTDDDHRNFQKGLHGISVAAQGSHDEAMVWARDAGIKPDVMQRLLSGMLKTKVASCSDPIFGEFAPNNGQICSNTLACIKCNALAVLASDLYRIASLERRINLDLESGALQGESRARFKEILAIINAEIFSQFEIRLVKIARRKAEKALHPLWDRPITSGEL